MLEVVVVAALLKQQRSCLRTVLGDKLGRLVHHLANVLRRHNDTNRPCLRVDHIELRRGQAPLRLTNCHNSLACSGCVRHGHWSHSTAELAQLFTWRDRNESAAGGPTASSR